MEIKEIGEKITFSTKNFGSVTAEITGRNWSFSTLLSYTVRAKIGSEWMDVPVCPTTLKAQLAL